MSKHIVLLGLMGSGKSTVGQSLGEELELPWVDIDASIVARHGAIESLFAQGEAHFRAIECEEFQRALNAPRSIISPGGGIVTYAPSRSLLAQHTRIYIEVSLDLIVERLAASETLRPLVGAQPQADRVQQLWEERHHWYEESDYRVDGSLPVLKVVRAIRAYLENQEQWRS